ncbi:uncharacterized protein ELE39_000552 [Cryptosporidium sp. chipmunk genotype I]|uniref:uncharacterized protein n=1 Tax=Cryptosporidium sp. chipmunk genotype I TaxID=1280935 RepID=UPI00351A075C|nr:hypothetical protein ELE39_000552 [Cryptosporidium sp. chipmunk genotype I]
MVINRYLVVLLIIFFVVFLSLTEELTCSVVMKFFKIVKQQKEKFKPYEERTPKISKQSELSEFEKKQLYWYYKDYIGIKEIKKAWKTKDRSGNITDEEIFSGKSFIPVINEFSRFGQQISNNFKNITPNTFNTELGAGMLEKSNVVFYRGDNKLNLDNLGRLKKEDQSTIKDKLKINLIEKSFNYRKSIMKEKSEYIWASLVSPCDGEIQFNIELEETLTFQENKSLYIIYCINGSVRERYSLFKGKVVEFLNGRLIFKRCENIDSKLNLSQRFSVKKGEVILRILENYYPPIFESNLIAIPLFMPCSGKAAWGKEHGKVFVKGEQIVEFICTEKDKIIAKHLISPSRGYTESLQQDESGEEISRNFLDKSFNSSIVQAGNPIGVIWLELNGITLSKDRFSSFSKETLIRMPCSGRLEYPISESSFVLKNEVSYRIISELGEGGG